MLNDIRYAIRMMWRTPVFSGAVVLTIAIALAANTAIFSVVNAVLLRPLPFHDPDHLVQVAEKNDKLQLPTFSSSTLNFLSWREQTQSFEELAAVGFNNYTLTGSGEPEQFSGNPISPALMRVLGLSPVMGRAFYRDEENLGAAPVAMLGEGVWKRRFGGDAAIIGQHIDLNGVSTVVVGIAPRALKLISAGEIYTPLVIDRAKENRLSHQIITFGRLKPGVTLAQAQDEMDAIATRVGQQFPETRDWGIRLVPAFDTFVSPQLKRGLLVLLWAVTFVLLIACANIANLLLARATGRQNELAVRTALGAERGRLLRQLLVESMLLSLLGGAMGLIGAVAGVRYINHSVPANTLPIEAIPIDGAVLSFTLVLTVLTGLIFGIVPAWKASRVDLNAVLKKAGRGSSGGFGNRLRNALAGGELALATILLAGAGLLIQTLAHLEHVPLGFDSRALITFQLAPPAAKYPGSKPAQFYRALLESVSALPGVRGAAVSSGIPFGAGLYARHPMVAVGQSVLAPDTLVPIDWRTVSPEFFQTMQVPLLRGRDFTYADGNGSPVMIVSEATARKFWGDADPLGRTLARSGDPQRTPITVIGVVGDVRLTALNQESPALYYPITWRTWPVMDVVVRTSGPPEAMLPSIRQKLHDLDSQLALANVRTMDEWLANSAAQPRLNSVLLGVFAVVAIIIASIGIYGVLAYSVSQRTGEIGLRMALGATRQRVLGLIITQGMSVALAGVIVGVVGALALSRALAALLYGVRVHDPITFVVSGAVLSAVALAACAVPAMRASRVDPMVALRNE